MNEVQIIKVHENIKKDVIIQKDFEILYMRVVDLDRI